jgi:hypothetical protein
MEPERKIEKLLRAYAKKRKADAGDAFTLSPATRRRLQAEVDKQFAEPPEEESVSLWQLFRQQWAVLTAFALVIFLVAAAFLPALSKAKSKAQSLASPVASQPSPAAPQIADVDNSVRLSDKLPEPTNIGLLVAKMAPGAADKTTSVDFFTREKTDSPAGARREVAEKIQPGDKPAFDRPVPATAPVAASGTLALNSANTFGGGGGGGGGNQFGLENKDTFAAAAAPAQAKQLFRDEGRAGASQPGVNAGSQRFRNGVPNAAPVLAAFELRQNGGDISVVDADGSIYQGSLQTNAVDSKLPAPVAASAGGAQNQLNAGNNFYFRVSGRNRSSQQSVVFTGSVLPPAGGGASDGNVSQAQNTSLFFNARIVGTAVLEQTNSIDIRADAVTP